MALAPVTYRPIEQIQPITRKDPQAAKAGSKKPKKRKPPPGMGLHVDEYV